MRRHDVRRRDKTDSEECTPVAISDLNIKFKDFPGGGRAPGARDFRQKGLLTPG